MKSRVLHFITALPALLMCFVLAAGWHFLIFGGKIIPAVGAGVYMTIMFGIVIASELSSTSST